MKPRWQSLIEAILNVLVGLLLSFALQIMLFEAMEITASLAQNIVITAAFSGLSLVRSYVLRRVFNGLLRDRHKGLRHRSAESIR